MEYGTKGSTLEANNLIASAYRTNKITPIITAIEHHNRVGTPSHPFVGRQHFHPRELVLFRENAQQLGDLLI